MTIGIDEKTSEEITVELLEQMPDTYQKNVGYFIWDFFRAISMLFEASWKKLCYLAGFFDITKLGYDDLVLFVKQRRGIIAKSETYATGDITVTSGSGLINKGDVFETSAELRFVSIETKEITEGESFKAQCIEAGSIGNVPKNTISTIPNTIQGINSITNLEAFSGGYEKETKESIIERYLNDLQKPVTSGNVYHYEKWALECAGVGKVKVKPLWNGDNTVKVIIADSNNQVAGEELVKSVQTYIDPYVLDEDNNKIGWGCGNGQAPIGAYCTVESGSTLIVNVKAAISLKTQVDLEAAKTNIEENILNYFKSTVFNDTYVSYARIGACILSSDGVMDYTNLTLNEEIDNIEILETSTYCQIAQLGELDITLME